MLDTTFVDYKVCVLVIYGTCTCLTSPENASQWIRGMTLPQRNINVMCGNNINTRRVLIDTRWSHGSPESALCFSYSVSFYPSARPKRISVSQGNLCSHKQTISNGQLFAGPAGNDSRLAYNFRWSTKSRKSTSLPAVGEVLRIDQMSHPCRAVSEP